MEKELKLVGPFRQVLTMSNMPVNGTLHDKQLAIIKEGGILIAGNNILEVGDFEQLQLQWGKEAALVLVEGDQVALPGFIDCHTHIAFAGNRANDFALEMQAQATWRLQRQEVGSGAPFPIRGIVT